MGHTLKPDGVFLSKNFEKIPMGIIGLLVVRKLPSLYQAFAFFEERHQLGCSMTEVINGSLCLPIFFPSLNLLLNA